MSIKEKRIVSVFFEKNKMSVNGAIFKSFKAQVNFLTFAWQFDAAKKRRDNCYLLISIKISSALWSIFCHLFKKCLNNLMSTSKGKKDCNLNAGWRGQKLFVNVLYFIWVKVKRAKLCHFQVSLPQMRCWLTIFEVNPPPLNTAIVRWKNKSVYSIYTSHCKSKRPSTVSNVLYQKV